MDGRRAENDKALYANIDEEGLVDLGESLFLHFRDEYARKFRKMLMLTQHSSRELTDLFIRRYFSDPLDYQEASFKMLSESGHLAPEDPQIMALHYYGPIFLLHILCDARPELEQDALKMNARHIRQFIRIYGSHKANTQQ